MRSKWFFSINCFGCRANDFDHLASYRCDKTQPNPNILRPTYRCSRLLSLSLKPTRTHIPSAIHSNLKTPKRTTTPMRHLLPDSPINLHTLASLTSLSSKKTLHHHETKSNFSLPFW